jgi:formate dehydrogenase
VVLDVYLTETAAAADYFLPCTTFFERADLPIFHQNLMQEPYVQWTDAVIPPQGEAKPEWEVFTLLSEAMGLPLLDSRVFTWLRRAARLVGGDLTPTLVADAMLRLGPRGDRYLPWRDGLSLAALRRQPHGVRLGPIRTGILGERLRTPDGKVHLHHPEIAGEFARLRTLPPAADPAYPFRLIGRRDPRSNNSWLHNVPGLMDDRCHRLRVHPDDAARLGVHDGETVTVRSRVGAIEVAVRLSDEVMPGVVSLPHGWGHRAAGNRHVGARTPGADYNALIDPRAIEPLAGMAFLNGFPVSLERQGDGDR